MLFKIYSTGYKITEQKILNGKNAARNNHGGGGVGGGGEKLPLCVMQHQSTTKNNVLQVLTIETYIIMYKALKVKPFQKNKFILEFGWMKTTLPVDVMISNQKHMC